MKTATLLKNGSHQIVRLPEEFQFEGERVYIHKVGNVIVLIPENNHPWKPLFESLEQFTADYMNERNQPFVQEREDIFA